MRPIGVITQKGRFVQGDVLGQYAVKAEVQGSRQLTPDLFWDYYGPWRLVQPLYNPEALAKTLEVNTYHARAAKTKARDVAGLGWELEPTGEDAPDQDRDVLVEFFESCSEPLSTVLYRASLDFDVVGYGALELVKEDYATDGAPVDLLHLPAHTARIHVEGDRFVQWRGGRRRWFKAAGTDADLDLETGRWHGAGELGTDARASELIWFADYTPRSDYYGTPSVTPALGAIHGDLARRDYNLAFFENYGIPSYLVTITGNYDPGPVDEETGKTELEQTIEDYFESLADSPHSGMVLTIPTRGRDEEVQVNFEPLATETKDASFRLFRKDNRDEVLAAHGVPPYRLGIAEEGSLGGNTAQATTEIYKRSIVEPRQETLEKLINAHVVRGGFGIRSWRFRLGRIDTTDEAHELGLLAKLFGMGAVTPNDLIRSWADRFGLEEIEDPIGDAHFVNNRPIDAEVPAGGDPATEAALLDLESQLLEVAQKYANNGEGAGGGPGGRELSALITSIKNITRPKAPGPNGGPPGA